MFDYFEFKYCPAAKGKIYAGMMKTCLLIFGLGVQFLTIVLSASPHEISATIPSPACNSCHEQTPAGAPASTRHNNLMKAVDYRLDGVAMCSNCHQREQDAHPLGDQPDFAVPADLPLGGNGEITCLTCHYTHGALTSKRTNASVSFIDRIFNSERLHKSYLLRRNNSKGELCMACHNF